MEKSEKIYIAGHDGMVGSAIVRKLKIKGYHNLVFRTIDELNLINQGDVLKFFEKEKPDYVFLAAAKVGGILANNTYPAQFIYENLQIQNNIIHNSYKFNVKKLLFLGSSCIYPKHAPQPLKEEYLLTGPLESTNEPYAIAKIAGIKMCQYYNKQYKTNFISVMPTNLFGPNDNYNLDTSHVLPALLRKFHLAKLLHAADFERIIYDFEKYGIPGNSNLEKLTNIKIMNILEQYGISKEDVTLWGSGSPFREFLHVDDLADACLFLMQNLNSDKIGEFVNIGRGVDLPIKELASLIKAIVDYKGTIRWDSSKPDGTPKKLLDIDKMIKLGWKAEIGIKEGIIKVYKAYSA